MFHDMSTVTFPWQHNGLQVLSIQRENQSFPPSSSVIYGSPEGTTLLLENIVSLPKKVQTCARALACVGTEDYCLAVIGCSPFCMCYDGIL